MDLLSENVVNIAKFELMLDARNCYEYEFVIKIEESDLCFNWYCIPFKYQYPIATGKVTMDGEMIEIDIFNKNPLFKDKNGNLLTISIDHFKEQITQWFLDYVRIRKEK